MIHKSFASLMTCLLMGCLASPGWSQEKPDSPADTAAGRYTKSETPSRDGIGKIYMGREISHVMGHLGAEWLERPEREREEKPALLISALELEEGMKVADIGAGTGYFTRRLAMKVGDEGKVYAVDIQPEMLELLEEDMKERGIANVAMVQGTETNPNLPENTLDLVLMVDVYHEFSHPYEMLREIHVSLKTGGRAAFVEYRLEDPTVPIKRLHKMSEAQVIREAEAVGLKHLKTDGRLPRQHIVLFEKK